ncbi:hypothetical protein D3C72_1859650 [compost metagenome]
MVRTKAFSPVPETLNPSRVRASVTARLSSLRIWLLKTSSLRASTICREIFLLGKFCSCVVWIFCEFRTGTSRIVLPLMTQAERAREIRARIKNCFIDKSFHQRIHYGVRWELCLASHIGISNLFPFKRHLAKIVQ